MNVDFKQPKRMKKRRELDALVKPHNGAKGKGGSGSSGSGAHGRRVKKKGQHELLVKDSESSEFEDFGLTQKTVIHKYVPRGQNSPYHLIIFQTLLSHDAFVWQLISYSGSQAL